MSLDTRTDPYPRVYLEAKTGRPQEVPEASDERLKAGGAKCVGSRLRFSKQNQSTPLLPVKERSKEELNSPKEIN